MFTKTLLPDTLRAIKLISGFTAIKQAYLDFFTQHEFNETELSAKLASLPEFIQDGTTKWTVWGKIAGTKFNIFYYKYPLLEETLSFEGIQLANLADIAAMKIHAIADRGTKRDFVDVYFLAKKYTLSEMLDYYQKKYGVSENRLYAILRSLDYFEDADQESEMPNMLAKVSWEKVKEFFRKETPRLTEKKLQT